MATTIKLAPGLAMEKDPNTGEIRVYQKSPQIEEYDELPEGFEIESE